MIACACSGMALVLAWGHHNVLSPEAIMAVLKSNINLFISWFHGLT